MSEYLTQEALDQFHEQGFLGPFDLLCASEQVLLNRQLGWIYRWHFAFERLLSRLPGPKATWRRLSQFIWRRRRVKWRKGMHASYAPVYQLATRYPLLDRLESILGPSLLLWGAVIKNQPPLGFHPWHTDAEHLEWPGVTVWLCLESLPYQAPFRAIARSHRLPMGLNELRSQKNIDVYSDSEVVQAAQAFDPNCEVALVDVQPGQFVIFSGRLWHGVKNESSVKARRAIIFQYCHPEAPVKIPLNPDGIPVQWDLSVAAPCCLVRGLAGTSLNRLVPPPGKLSRSQVKYSDYLYWFAQNFAII